MSADGDFMRTVAQIAKQLGAKIEVAQAAQELGLEVQAECLDTPMTMHRWEPGEYCEYPMLALGRLIEDAAEQIREADRDRQHTLWGC